MPAGVGAALGTLIADSAKYGYLYPGSYLASVWGNFLGFFLFGVITRRFSWGRFVIASNVTLTVANFVVAVLYVMVFKILYLGDAKYLAFSNEAVVIFIFGLTVWWFVTMLPFVLLVTPILIVIAARTMPSFITQSLRKQSLRQELPVNLFSMALLVPGVVMIILGLLTAYSSMGSEITRYFGATTTALMQWMFLLSGITLSVLGFGLKIRRLFRS
jgi:hypothetical protein